MGEVTSTRSQKTISVLVYSLMKHVKYKKYIRRHSVFKAHDEKELAKLGDRVKIFETRPISKTKRWCLEKILAKNEGKGFKSEVNKEFGAENVMEGIVKKEKPVILPKKEKEVDVKAENKEQGVQEDKKQEVQKDKEQDVQKTETKQGMQKTDKPKIVSDKEPISEASFKKEEGEVALVEDQKDDQKVKDTNLKNNEEGS